MANLFNVDDQVICQKLGGQSGTKTVSPPFPGVVKEVLAGGTKYRVDMRGYAEGTLKIRAAPLRNTAPQGLAPKVHFHNGIVDEAHMTAA